MAIVTTTPNALMKDIHNRMSVILDKNNALKWLNPETSIAWYHGGDDSS